MEIKIEILTDSQDWTYNNQKVMICKKNFQKVNSKLGHLLIFLQEEHKNFFPTDNFLKW